MTIALGIQADDGIVLAADQQITKEDGLKYNECKLRLIAPEKPPFDWGIGLTYSGNPDYMKLFLERAASKIQALKPKPSVAKAQKIIESVLSKTAEEHEDMNLEMLCGISIPPEPNRLLLTKNKLVRVCQLQCLGVGDSSLIRYLDEIFRPLGRNTDYALRVAIYMIHYAKKYVDNCGGDTDVFVVSHGTIAPYMGAAVSGYEEFMSDAEAQFKDLIRTYLDPAYSNDAISHNAAAIVRGLEHIRRANSRP